MPYAAYARTVGWTAIGLALAVAAYPDQLTLFTHDLAHAIFCAVTFIVAVYFAQPSTVESRRKWFCVLFGSIATVAGASGIFLPPIYGFRFSVPECLLLFGFGVWGVWIFLGAMPTPPEEDGQGSTQE